MYDIVKEFTLLGNALYIQDNILKLNNNSDKNLKLNIQIQAKMLVSQASKLIDELEEAKNIIKNLENENESLRKELAKKPIAGRRRVYGDEKRAEIAHYREEHSYKETIEHFKISPDTLNRIIKEYRK